MDVAVKDDDCYVINGSKCFNTNGPLADYTVIYCLTDPGLGVMGVAAQGLGIAEGAFAIARKYLMERQQFGKPISKRQHLAFKMAELQTDIEGASLLLMKAAVCKEEGKPYSVPAAMAKLTCTDVTMKVSTEAVQLLGGNG